MTRMPLVHAFGPDRLDLLVDNAAIARLRQRRLKWRNASYSEAAKLTSVSETVALFI
jgi:hypothetical protein